MKIEFASIFPRLKAAFIDAVVMVALMYGATEILSLFDVVPNYIRILIAVFIFLLYEPIFVSLFGQTVGHSRINLIVRQEEEEDIKKNISFFKALIRFTLKFFLGWLSLLTVPGSVKRQAIHDAVVKSVVIEEVQD